jgi:arabinogalactan endo-1,4-beta-galactosidase
MKFATGLLLALVLAATVPARAREFYFGADLSFANEMDDCGAVFKDGGAPKDVFAVFKDHGTGLVRLRLWNNPDWTKYSTLDDVKKSIRRAKALGMKVLLDFHYSDDWADTGKQIVPAAWKNIGDDDKLAQALYQYTFDTLTALNREGLMPDMVQVGNETNTEILQPFPNAAGHAIDWERNAKFFNAGIKAVRDAAAGSAIKPQIVLHIAQPENVEPWIADAVKAGVTDFDVIAVSFYAKWSKYTMAGLGGTINRLRHRYPRVQVMVAETAYPWTTKWNDTSNNVLGADALVAGYSATPADQKRYMVDITQAVIANDGMGVVYWAPDWVSTSCRTRWGQGSNWENATFFDFDGNALPAIDFPKAHYTWPVAVTFRFSGAPPEAGKHFILWGDFLGARDIAVVLPNGEGKLEYTATLMPGQKYRLQVFSDSSLQKRLLAGANVENGFYAGATPGNDAVIDIDLVQPR